MQFTGYDIIGDIHGYGEALIRLLLKLGYSINEDGCYSHATRKVIFLGDFIDRGADQKLVINTVRKMVDNGKALAVIGNHEFNAIAYNTLHPITGLPLRAHTEKNKKLHIAFLNSYSDLHERQVIIDWFKTLPVFIDLPEFRIIHAFFNERDIRTIKPLLNEHNALTDVGILAANDKANNAYNALERLLKGVEVALPQGSTFSDKDGNVRTRIRIKWWKNKLSPTYKNFALVPQKIMPLIPDMPIPEEQLRNIFYTDTKPVFIGHYWLTGKPKVQSNTVCCLDYSVAKNGFLTAYQWNVGDKGLTNDKYIQVNCLP